jgi:hypothetical protein
MIVYKNRGYEDNSTYPNGNFSSDEQAFVVDETTPEGKALSDKIKSKFPFYDLEIDSSGNPIGIFFFEPIKVILDKLEILADGIDTATITATVDDPASTETIELYHGETLVDSKPAVAGSASFEVTMSAPGTLTLTVKSTTKYGQRDIVIKGV